MSTASYDVCHIEDSIKARAAASCQRWWRINSLTLFLLWELKDNTFSVCVCVFMRCVTCFFASCQRGNNIGFGAKRNGNLIFDFIFYSNIFPVTLLSGSLICGLPEPVCVLLFISLLCWMDVSYSHLAGIWGELPFSVWFSGSAVMSIPALIPVALTSLQRPRQNNGGEEERESWTVVIGELSNNMAAASEDD